MHGYTIPAHTPSSQTAQITYVGHATVLIEMEGVRLLTDPILRDRVAAFLRRHPRTDIATAHYESVDAVLISHVHHDHLHPPSLRMVDRNTRILVPYGAGAFLRRRGFRHVDELRAGDAADVRGLRVIATHADHSMDRHPFGLRADCLGYLIQGRYSVYFPGDTDLFPEMDGLAEGLDVALLPVWGWGPTLGTGHMDPKRAAEALALLRPRMAIPIHWGALRPAGFGRFNPDFLTLPPLTFAQHAAALAPAVAVQIVQPGGMVALHHALP